MGGYQIAARARGAGQAGNEALQREYIPVDELDVVFDQDVVVIPGDGVSGTVERVVAKIPQAPLAGNGSGQAKIGTHLIAVPHNSLSREVQSAAGLIGADIQVVADASFKDFQQIEQFLGYEMRANQHRRPRRRGPRITPASAERAGRHGSIIARRSRSGLRSRRKSFDPLLSERPFETEFRPSQAGSLL